MPLLGTLDVASRLDGVARLDNYDTEAWEIPDVELLSTTFEIDDKGMTASLPAALHPTIPPVVYFSVASYPKSPIGDFTLAQVRVGCRASALPRGFLLRAFSDSPVACEALGRRWGYDCRPADVRLRRYHDRVLGTVELDGREVLRVSLIDPLPISGASVFHVSTVNLGRADDDGGRGVLVQVDPAYIFQRAERGTPELTSFERAAWNAEGIDPVWPVTATFVRCDTGFPRIRYVMDAQQPARTGTRKLR
ncbi:MAG TPA: acetoacetate decarboxylase family protein [Dehalococcoidia bacterium]|jgi:hypothetical protein|nr:acetoacetate decarboxylase family protein [Dehalococcoidia bacterium]